MVVDLTFGKERIRRLRQRMGLTQEAFAAEVGVKQSAVSLWESGARTPEGSDVLGRLLALETEAPPQKEAATR